MNATTCMTNLVAAGMMGAVLSAVQASETILLDADVATITWNAHPDRHYGERNWFTVAADTGHGSFIRFDLNGLTLPTIENAEVRLEHLNSYGNAGNMEYRFYGITPGTANEDYIHGPQQDVEPGAEPPLPLTWNNAPGLASELTAPALNLDEIWGGGTMLGSLQADWLDYGWGSSEIFSFSTDELVDYLTAVLQSEKKLANLIIMSAEPVAYDDRVIWVGNTYEGNLHGQGEYGPQLQLTLVPEPASLALASLAGTLLLARRRRSSEGA